LVTVNLPSDPREPFVPRPARLLCGLAASLLLVTGCSGGSASTGPSGSTPRKTASVPAASSDPLLQGLDVCKLATPAQVRRAAGQVGEPTNRSLTRIAGYAALVDQCGFGVSFDSYTLLVSVGLAPATKADLARLPGRAVDGIGDAARTDESGRFTTVSFLKGASLVQVQADKNSDGTDRADRVAAVATEIARAVPSDPPETDEQTSGVCARVDPSAVEDVLGKEPGLSRSFTYPSGSATCSWATAAVDPRSVSVSVYTNPYAGPFLADLEGTEPSAVVPGITGGFTIPGIAYAVAADGQAVSVGGTFPPRVAPRKPLPVTPQLKALLGSAVSLLQ
jgi:hypothetical protein